jgi:hypothetical protein
MLKPHQFHTQKSDNNSNVFTSSISQSRFRLANEDAYSFHSPENNEKKSFSDIDLKLVLKHKSSHNEIFVFHFYEMP